MLAFARRRAAAIAICLALPASIGAVTREAAAQAPKRPKSVRDLLPDDAKKQWDSGVALATRGQWDPARAAFLQAYEQSKNPRVLFNVAVAEKNLNRYADAIQTFRRELSEGKGLLSAEEEQEISTAIAGLEQYVMTLTIEVSEPGAKVYVDDVEVGTSPLPKPVTVSLGGHRVRATKIGFAEAIAQVPGNERNPKVTLKLEANVQTAPVTVAIVGPQSAVVKVDGREVGIATRDNPFKAQVTVSPEPHLFSAEAPGYVTTTQPVKVAETGSYNLTLQLAPEQQKGKLLVVTRPEGATIEIDGHTVGASRWEGPVDSGTHQVVVKKQGHYTFSQDVDVPRGEKRSITASLNLDRNTSFVPWLVGTIVVVAAGAAAGYFLFRPEDEEPVNGTLPPFALGTRGVRF